jgi:hypothetical protein
MKIRNKKYAVNKQAFQIKCTCCAKYYPNTYGWDQGRHCASYVVYQVDIEKKSYIQCEYGSGFDTMRFTINNPNIIKKKHKLANTKRLKSNDKDIVVCDKCIEKYLRKGFVIEDKAYDYFSFIDELNSFHAEDPQRYFEIMREGPENCMRLIREERAKPLEQRMKEREGKSELKLTRLEYTSWTDFFD